MRQRRILCHKKSVNLVIKEQTLDMVYWKRTHIETGKSVFLYFFCYLEGEKVLVEGLWPLKSSFEAEEGGKVLARNKLKNGI